MKIKSYAASALGAGLGTAIYDAYQKGLSGVDWYKVIFVTLVTLAIVVVVALLTQRNRTV